MLFTNYTNCSTKLAVTEMIQILIKIYYLGNDVINPQQKAEKHYKIILKYLISSSFLIPQTNYSYCIRSFSW